MKIKNDNHELKWTMRQFIDEFNNYQCTQRCDHALSAHIRGIGTSSGVTLTLEKCGITKTKTFYDCISDDSTPNDHTPTNQDMSIENKLSTSDVDAHCIVVLEHAFDRDDLLAVKDALQPHLTSKQLVGLLSLACTRGETVLKYILDDPRFDPNENRDAPIRFAIEHNRVGAMKALLADPRVNPANYSELVETVMHERMLEIMIDDQRFQLGEFSLERFIRNMRGTPQASAVKVLLDRGIVDKSGYALKLALISGYKEIADLLIADPRRPFQEGLVDCALMRGYSDIAKLAINDPRMTSIKSITLICAIELGDIEIVKLLLADERMETDDYCLICAVFENRIDILKLLLEDSRFNPGASENYALSIAATEGYDDILSLLLADPRVTLTHFSFMRMVYRGSASTTMLMLNHGCRGQHSDCSERNCIAAAGNFDALKVSSLHGHVEVTKILLNHFGKNVGGTWYACIMNDVNKEIEQLWLDHFETYGV